MAEPHQTASVRVVAWLFVAAQFALIGLMVFAPRDSGFDVGTAGETGGMALMIVGAAVGVWAALYLGRGLTASPLPNGASELVVAGPYRWVRHPMYLAVMLFMGGVAARSGSWLVVTGYVLLGILFSIKARWEEGHLRSTFLGYEGYAKTTPRFVPNPSARSNPAAAKPMTQQPTNREDH